MVQSIEEPLVNFDQNARGTLVALEAARRADVGRFVFSSSNAPLGNGAYPAREDKPVAPLSPYGASKAVGEAYCSAFHGAYGMHAVTVRFSNAFGPRSAHKGNVIPSSFAVCGPARSSWFTATASRRATSSSARTWPTGSCAPPRLTAPVERSSSSQAASRRA